MRSGPRGHVGEQSGWEGGPTTQHRPEQVLVNLCKRKKGGGGREERRKWKQVVLGLSWRKGSNRECVKILIFSFGI